MPQKTQKKRTKEAVASSPPSRPSLHQRTRLLLIHRPRTVTLDEISAATDVSVAWLDSIVADRTKEPSVNSIQRLYEYLSGQELSY